MLGRSAGPLLKGAGDQEQMVRGVRLGRRPVQFGGGWTLGWGGGTQWGKGSGEGEGLIGSLRGGAHSAGCQSPACPGMGTWGPAPFPTPPAREGGVGVGGGCGSHRLLRWPPFFFFFFLGGGDAELLDQCLVLGEKGGGVGRGGG